MRRARRADIRRLTRENEEQMQTIQGLWTDLRLPYDIRVFGRRKPVKSASANVEELQKRLREKRDAYDRLERKISDYMSHADQFEIQLQRNEAEKAELLGGFQRIADDDMTLEDLDAKACADELGELMIEEEMSNKMYSALKGKLKRSQDKLASLEREQMESGNSLRHTLAARHATIRDLRKKRDECETTIRRLRNDNKMLENAMASDDSM